MKKYLLTLVIATTLFLPSFAQSIISEAEFSMDGISKVEINSGFGDIFASGYSGKTTDFKGVIKGNSDRDYAIRYERNGNTVKIWIDSSPSKSWSTNNISARFDLKIPNDVIVTLKSSSGDIEAGNLSAQSHTFSSTSGNIDLRDIIGRSEVNATSGDIDIRGLNGQLTLVSTSGIIDALDIKGPVEFKSTSGDVRLSNITTGRITGKSTSGNIELATVSGEFRLISTSGNITLRAADISAASSFEATSGSISITLVNGTEQMKFDAKSSSGSVNIGNVRGGKQLQIGSSNGPAILLVTSSGNINVK